MWEYMERRARMCAEYILDTGATVRDCAAHFAVSKSTVHKDITERLYAIDRNLYNLRERHIRGGDATRRKYAQKKSPSSKFVPE